MRLFGFDPFAKIFVNRVMVHGLALPDLSGDIDFHEPIFTEYFRRTYRSVV